MSDILREPEHWRDVAVGHELLPAEQVVAGSPTTGFAELDAFTPAEVGVWEHSRGSSTDIEVDEFFVVLMGSATVTDLDTNAVIELAPGSLCALRAGMRSRWDVHEDLRKLTIAGTRQETQ